MPPTKYTNTSHDSEVFYLESEDWEIFMVE